MLLSRSRAGTTLALAALLCATSASADDVKEKRPLVFGADVSLVQVPVFVSGKDGAAQGLTIDDFRIEEDGKPVKVVSFRLVDTTSDEQQESIRRSSAARRRFLLLFDKSFTDPAGLARARKYASEFVLHDLAASDLVAVATFDYMQGIKLIANFTEDRRVAEHAIYSLGVTSLSKISDPLAIAGDFGFTDLAREIGTSADAETPSDLINDINAALAARARAVEEQSYNSRVMTLLDSFEHLGTSLSRIDGRKQVVYFSTGFNSTMLVGQDQADQTRAAEAIVGGRLWEVDSDSRYGNSHMRTEVHEALEHLSRADAVVHSIDLGGIGYKEEYKMSVGDRGMPTRDAGGRESLALIAAETGGRFYKDANNLRPVLKEMADMTSRYYVLGVQPREPKPGGGFRKLKVRVKPKGLRVSHRPGFFERSDEITSKAAPFLQRQFEAAELLLARDQPRMDEDLPFGVLILPVPSDTEKQSLGIMVQVPKAALAGTGPLEIYGYAISTAGEVEDHFAHFLRLDPDAAIANSESGWQGLSFAGRFEVPPGAYTFKFLAQRPETGESGMRFFEVTVPERQASRGFLLPPLFLDKSDGWSEVALKSRDLSGMPIEMQVGGVSFIPRTQINVRPGRRERIVLIAYDPETAKDPAVDVDIRTTLSDDSGRHFLPGAITVENVVRSDNGRRSYVLGFTPQDIPPGEYTLRMHIGEKNSVLQSYCRLTVLPRESADSR